MCFIRCPVSRVSKRVWHSPLSVVSVPVAIPLCGAGKGAKSAEVTWNLTLHPKATTQTPAICCLHCAQTSFPNDPSLPGETKLEQEKKKKLVTYKGAPIRLSGGFLSRNLTG